jgi:hypothetical protein
MLLYRTSDGEDAITKHVNEALSRGYLTVYLPVKTAPLLSESIKYEENVNQGNLLTFDTRTFYSFALAGSLESFEELKVLVEEAVEEEKIRRIASKRNDKDVEEANVVIVAGVAAELVRNGKFDESIKIEEWWQKTYSEWLQKGLKVTIICPHLGSILDKDEFIHYKQALSSLHDIVVERSGPKRGLTV